MARKRLAAVAVVLLVATGPAARATERASEAEASDAARTIGEAPAAPDIDLWRVRNIFRYEDEARAHAGPAQSQLLAVFQHFNQAKIREYGPIFVNEQYVAGLNITVDDVMLMYIIERGRNIAQLRQNV